MRSTSAPVRVMMEDGRGFWHSELAAVRRGIVGRGFGRLLGLEPRLDGKKQAWTRRSAFLLFL